MQRSWWQQDKMIRSCLMQTVPNSFKTYRFESKVLFEVAFPTRPALPCEKKDVLPECHQVFKITKRSFSPNLLMMNALVSVLGSCLLCHISIRRYMGGIKSNKYHMFFPSFFPQWKLVFSASAFFGPVFQARPLPAAPVAISRYRWCVWRVDHLGDSRARRPSIEHLELWQLTAGSDLKESKFMGSYIGDLV